MKGLAIWGLVFSLAFTGVAGVNSSCRHESRTSAIRMEYHATRSHTYYNGHRTAECTVTEYWCYIDTRCAVCGEVLGTARNSSRDEEFHSASH